LVTKLDIKSRIDELKTFRWSAKRPLAAALAIVFRHSILIDRLIGFLGAKKHRPNLENIVRHEVTAISY